VLDLLWTRWVRRLVFRIQEERQITGSLSRKTWALFVVTMLVTLGLLVGVIWVLLNPSLS
jgi:hypothetical protein